VFTKFIDRHRLQRTTATPLGSRWFGTVKTS